MKLKLIAAAALIAAAGISAQAQTPPPPPPASGMQQMHEHVREQMQKHMQERMQKRMESFKRILQITPNQEGAWNTWAAAMRPPQGAMHDRAKEHEAFEHMSTPERIDRMRQMRAQRNAEMDRRADATKALYAQLTPPQQKAFDEVSLKFMHHGHRHGGGHHGE